MRLIKLTIDRFKNLNDFVVEFDKEAFTTVLLGRNGTGKSNLLEALIIIFRDLDLGDLPSFKYQIEYLCRDHNVQIDADPQRRREPVSITIDDQRLSYRRFIKQEERRYLPSYVFGYYSGPSNKMEKHFEKHQEKFYRDLLQGVDKPLRPLIYAHDTHRQLALPSFFNEQDPQRSSF
jgi:predicted ATP-dependent endonuclease of OLD family